MRLMAVLLVAGCGSGDPVSGTAYTLGAWECMDADDLCTEVQIHEATRLLVEDEPCRVHLEGVISFDCESQSDDLLELESYVPDGDVVSYNFPILELHADGTVRFEVTVARPSGQPGMFVTDWIGVDAVLE
jgi:hypothetical protein